MGIWKTQPVLQRRHFFQGRPLYGSGVADVTWFDATGAEMTDEAWATGWVRSFGVRWAGDVIPGTDERGRAIRGDTLLLLFNSHHEAQPFRLPELKPQQIWELLFDTTNPEEASAARYKSEEVYHLQPRSMAVLRTTKAGTSGVGGAKLPAGVPKGKG